MSIFKRLFGSSDKLDNDSKANKPDIEKLLKSENLNNSVIELDNYICQLCCWGRRLDRLNEAQMVFFFNQNLEREINNGGFNQYFRNSSGDFANKTINSLEAIKAITTVEILRKAINQFPNNNVPTERKDRSELVDQIEEKANPIWEQLDQKFFEYADNLNALNIDFIRLHKDKF
jgi:hypothetical protein